MELIRPVSNFFALRGLAASVLLQPANWLVCLQVCLVSELVKTYKLTALLFETTSY